ncbi:metal ABC transporter permease [Streptomyces litmocidini]|uniref:metal ABC transporter permease n=1 Tax=Streptomyces litmocidini TaxID=67318 RepID=UPI00167D42C9|nr:metal ABC transporter permease [Streptomyces litmocidini]
MRAFALGLVLVSTRDGWTTDLSSFLSGQVLAVDAAGVRRVAGIGAVPVAVVLALRRFRRRAGVELAHGGVERGSRP